MVKMSVHALSYLIKMLNESNSHCYLRYPEHGPTTDINTFNATALLILFRYAIDYNTKLIYH